MVPPVSNAKTLSSLSESKIKSSFWSPLTEIEISTLRNTPLAKTGDPDALLALAIMASGDIRTEAQYAEIKNTVRKFVKRIKPRLSAEKNTARKGFLLYSAMHGEFFSSHLSGDDLKAYRANQSRLTEIFRSQTFNCISSSLLYLILARYFDLMVEGVILPSHSFVQLTTPESQVIEIETTSRRGYGLRHNEAFYENSASHWSQLRGLPDISYEDYLNREIVSAFQLITENMNHQHTTSGRLAQRDRYRLNEIRAWLLPQDFEAQRNRLYVFNNELIRLIEKKDYQSASKLLNIAKSSIRYYKQALTSGQNLDNAIHDSIAFMFAARAEIALADDNYPDAIYNYKQALQWVNDPEQDLRLRQNISIAWLQQGNHFFSQQDYASAIAHYVKAQNKHNNNQLKQTIDDNISSAFWNMAVAHLNTGDIYSAYDLLSQCRSQYPHIEQCQKKMDEICQSYSLADCRR